MRFVSAFVLALGLVVAAGAVTTAQEKKGEKKTEKKGESEKPKPPDRPPLDAKEWEKQKSGLEIWDVKEGEGKAVTANTASVTVHYTGWLTDKKETVFDSSIPRGKPNTFELFRVVKGWQTGLVGMKPGGVRRLKIPPELAYGKAGKGPIPGDATLIFEIELIK